MCPCLSIAHPPEEALICACSGLGVAIERLSVYVAVDVTLVTTKASSSAKPASQIYLQRQAAVKVCMFPASAC